MLTKNDIKLLVDNFATRAEFEHKMNEFEENMVTKDDFRKVMGLLESVYTEVKKIREEQSMHIGIHQRQDEVMTAIKERINKLEKHIAAT